MTARNLFLLGPLCEGAPAAAGGGERFPTTDRPRESRPERSRPFPTVGRGLDPSARVREPGGQDKVEGRACPAPAARERLAGANPSLIRPCGATFPLGGRQGVY